ncbi:MAG: DNA mismatch repair protein MutS [Bacteroidetes bacterium]|nr:DNA mismatch repair protein MutS [Bacteroidota bacterium]
MSGTTPRNPAKAGKTEKTTPLMGQYQRIKTSHPDALLLFRVGDFYETFSADAIRASAVLGITLTKRANGAASHVELAGFPYHSLDSYLPKLVRAGIRVAICEQLEDPKLTKTLVKRGVTELITPGLATGDKILDHKRNNFLGAIALADTEGRPSPGKNAPFGIALLDLSTGEFLVSEGPEDHIDRVLESYRPAEVLLAKSRMKAFQQRHNGRYYAYPQENWIFSETFGRDRLLEHFRTKNLKGFGVQEGSAVAAAAGAILHYLGQTEHHQLAHITGLRRMAPEQHMMLDRFTLRNLELLEANHPDGSSLLSVLDRTASPMGARMLRQWLALPLLDPERIERRLDTVEALLRDPNLRETLHKQLHSLGDSERTLARIAMGKAAPRDLGAIRHALGMLPVFKQVLAEPGHALLGEMSSALNPCADLLQTLQAGLADELPTQLGKGPTIRTGHHAELDDLRNLGANGRQYLAELQQKEAERSGITSLKVGYNGVFGYYLEVTQRYKDQVPPEWIRKQTLVNAERYITPELKVYEEKILQADERIAALEASLFAELCAAVHGQMAVLQQNAQLLARLDVLNCFARNALDFQYRRPKVNQGDALILKESRHPVIERLLPADQAFVPNDLHLDRSEQQVLIITGPNMSGKSALLRQTALIALMAQCGSFVPAASATIGIVDKLFTRVGASDNLSSGESTFMVEMLETASIANNLSAASLLVLDEIGRGTSTYDGISIAWSLAEYLHNHGDFKPRTLFATHYHELSELADQLPRVHNYHISTRESGEQVIFLRKLVAGQSQHSFGIHVARMAGMPPAIVQRAQELLLALERHGIGNQDPDQIKETLRELPRSALQLSIFDVADPALGQVREILRSLDVNQLTPVDSLLKLKELQDLLK